MSKMCAEIFLKLMWRCVLFQTKIYRENRSLIKGAVMKSSDLEQKVYALVKKDFAPKFGKLKGAFPQHLAWQKLKTLGSELWLDSGSIDDCKKLYTQ